MLLALPVFKHSYIIFCEKRALLCGVHATWAQGDLAVGTRRERQSFATLCAPQMNTQSAFFPILQLLMSVACKAIMLCGMGLCSSCCTAQESITAAIQEALRSAHHVHIPHLPHVPTDWFRRRHKDMAAMATPAGTSTAPIGSVINLLNGTLGAGTQLCDCSLIPLHCMKGGAYCF